MYLSTDGGGGWRRVLDVPNEFTGAVDVQIDPTDPRLVYAVLWDHRRTPVKRTYGGEGSGVHRSVDNGVTWTPISPDLTGGPGQDTYPYGTITTVAAAPSDPRTIWVGTDDGRVWLTRDLGATWAKVLDGQPWVTRIAVSDRDPATAYVTLSGYRSGSTQPHVLATRSAGARWTDISGNLPSAPVYDVVLERAGALYVATDQGVFVGNAAVAGHWLRLGHGLPRVAVDDIEYDARHHRLVAATFGRGLYETTVP
ncbi:MULTISPECIES: WD40/YVTN/BNR-like repeat-containing protein [Saccharothrix]|uniref:WD40/YVTN/BNR-like repeat-containing protein n=1 Tax=Saccharothrix TaxID=2071 RepID=UPI00095E5737|nr:hypothetical protein [Saccharothrix sp. CB00851]OKI35228.1 hypothetical protein A6A25_24070 [Saccharothrix sp. CB00851]